MPGLVEGLDGERFAGGSDPAATGLGACRLAGDAARLRLVELAFDVGLERGDEYLDGAADVDRLDLAVVAEAVDGARADPEQRRGARLGDEERTGLAGERDLNLGGLGCVSGAHGIHLSAVGAAVRVDGHFFTRLGARSRIGDPA